MSRIPNVVPRRTRCLFYCWAVVSACLPFASIAKCGFSEQEAVRPNCCGRYALALAADFTGVGQPPEVWKQILPAKSAPFSCSQLESAAREVGLDTLLAQWSDMGSADLDKPCILHVKATAESAAPDHFIVCFGRVGSAVCVANYPGRPVLVPRERLRGVWSGAALYVSRPGDGTLASLRWRLRGGVAWRAVGTLLLIVCLGYGWYEFRRSFRGRQQAEAILKGGAEEPR
jgi:hypothetical protein